MPSSASKSSASVTVERRPGRGRPPGNTAEATRKRLLEVAHRKFSDHGYEATATPDIVAAAGVSQSVLYHHFGSKAGLYTAVVKQVMDLTLEAFEQAIAGRTKLLDRLDGILEALTVIGPVYGPDNPIMVMAPFEVRHHSELRDAREQLRRNVTFFTELLEGAEDGDNYPPAVVQMGIAIMWGLTGIGAISSDQRQYLGAVEAVRALIAGTLGRGDEGKARPRRAR